MPSIVFIQKPSPSPSRENTQQGAHEHMCPTTAGFVLKPASVIPFRMKGNKLSLAYCRRGATARAAHSTRQDSFSSKAELLLIPGGALVLISTGGLL